MLSDVEPTGLAIKLQLSRGTSTYSRDIRKNRGWDNYCEGGYATENNAVQAERTRFYIP